jgi:hypothetical protein
LDTNLSGIYVRAYTIDIWVVGEQRSVINPGSLSDRHAVISRSDDVYGTAVLARDAQTEWLNRVSAVYVAKRGEEKRKSDLSLYKILARSVNLRVNVCQLETAVAISRYFSWMYCANPRRDAVSSGDRVASVKKLHSVVAGAVRRESALRYSWHRWKS